MINKELLNYIEKYVFPIYERNDKSHQLWHILGVIDRSLCIAKDYDVDINMVYVVAVFHDIGCHISRNNHEIESAKILLKDKYIKKLFDKYQIKIIKEAIEDHRASLTCEPRSIYGKIIATADKFLTIEDILKSIHLHTLEKYPNIKWKETNERCYKYLDKKYGKNGYAKIPLPFPPYDNFLKEVRKLLNDKNYFNKELKNVDTKIKKEFKDLV